jgi:hypothetical protein
MKDLAIMDLPAWLTCIPEKIECFVRDPAFCRGWRTVQDLEHEGIFSKDCLWNIGSVMFKADSLIRGNTTTGMRALAAAGFQIRSGRSVQFSERLVHEFWHYALGRYSDKRIALLARLLVMAPSLYLLVRADELELGYPTAIRLTDFKGEVAPGLRTATKLRAVLGAPQTAMFNYVHTADEPADVVRELGLLFDASARRAILLGEETGGAHAAQQLSEHMLAQTFHSDLDFTKVLEKLKNIISQLSANIVAPEDLRQASILAEEMAQGNEQAWTRLEGLIGPWLHDLTALDRLILDCQWVVLKRRCIRQPFPSCETHHWLASGISAPQCAIAK